MQGYLDRLQEVEPKVGSYLALNQQGALDQASAVDKAIAAGEQLGPLAGVPLAIKVLCLPPDMSETPLSALLSGAARGRLSIGRF